MTTAQEPAAPPAGLHRVQHEDPAALAAELGATLLMTVEGVERAAERWSRCRELDDAAIAELRGLARRIELARRVADRTRDRTAGALAGRLGPVRSMGVAIHPSSLRRSAATVLAARRQLADAQAVLEAHRQERAREQAELDEELSRDAAQRDAHAGGSSGANERPRAVLLQARTLVVGLLAVSLGTGLIVVGLGVAPAWIALLPTALIAAWGAVMLRRSIDDSEDGEDASLLLAEVAATTEHAFAARRAALVAIDERAPELEARVSLAAEEVRLAERNWCSLAGAGADPEDLEAVLRRFDPQHQAAVVLASETAAVRAAGVLLDRTWERWERAWTELGMDVPDVEDAAGSVEALAAGGPLRFVCTGDAAVLADDLAAALPSAAVVVVEATAPGRPAGAPGT